jgi:hypothetical protein
VATGTSFLSALLFKHHEIYLPKIQRPEPNFFHYTHKYKNGINWYLETWFQDIGKQKVLGERSSLLLPSENAPARIHRHFPDIKLIFCLRNPVERAWGNYRFTVLEGLETLSFEEALEKEEERKMEAQGEWIEIRPHAYVERSRYSACLREYFRIFPRKNILLLKSEAMGANPSATLKAVCEFLGADSNQDLEPPPNYSSPSVVDPLEQQKLRQYFGSRFPSLVEAIRKEQKPEKIGLSSKDADMLQRLQRNLHHKKEAMTPAAREILRNKLQEEIRALEAIVEFDIRDWR